MASIYVDDLVQEMKRKRYALGDVVEWRGNECVVTQLEPLRVRQTSPGLHREFHVVHVLPLDDWRARLRVNDDVEYYFEGYWLHSHVHSVNPLVVQPTFTRVLVPVYPHQIRRTARSIPHRFVITSDTYNRLDQVLCDGEWYVVDKCTSLYVLAMEGCYLPRASIVGCLRHEKRRLRVGTMPFVHGTEFSDSLSILESVPGEFRACWRQARQCLWRRRVTDLDEMVVSAMDNFDTTRVLSLTHAADFPGVYEMANWFEWRWNSVPYLEFEFTKTDCTVYWSGCSPLPPHKMVCFVKPVVGRLFDSVPVPVPVLLPVPETLMPWQVPCVKSMSAFEEVSVCEAFCDRVDGLLFSHYAGFVLRELPDVRGGVLCADHGLGKTWMLYELFLHNPVRTLCVVPLCVLSHWVSVGARMGVDVSVWHGPAKSSAGAFVLTTCRTMLRNPVEGFDRLILDEAQQVRCASSSMNALCDMDVSIRWYVSTKPRFKDCCTFLRVFPFTAEYLHEVDHEIPHAVGLTHHCALEVRPVCVKVRAPACWSEVSLSASDANVLRYDPSLLAPELLHEEILVTSDTLANINARVGRPVDLESNCPVCMESVFEPVVTQCGHVYCSDCANKLTELKSNCPLCRADLFPLTAVSSKPSDVFFINGRTYSRRDLSPGDLKTKLYALDRPGTTFVTRSPVIRRDLKVGDVRLVRDCVGIRLECDTLVFVDTVSPSERQQVLDRLLDPMEERSVDVVTFNY